MQVKRSLADPKAVSMLGQSMVVADAESRWCQKEQAKRQSQGRAAVLPTRGLQEVAAKRRQQAEVGNDTKKEEMAQVGDPPEDLDRDVTAQGTGAEAGGEAGQLMVVQQAEVGNDSEVEGAARVGFWIGN